MSAHLRSLEYRPEVDGLRALAILAVIIYHFWPSALPAGFMGVDVFFVISGYLITAILLKELATGEFSLPAFWGRRVRRILPALSACVIGVLLFANILEMPWLVNDAGKQGVATAACVSNYRMLDLVSDYWSPNADRLAFLHTWSLSVEEQFYLLLPPLLWLACRRLKGGALLAAFGLLAASSLIWCIWQTSANQPRAFFLMPARAWELLAGTLLAMAEPRLAPTRPIATALSWAGLALVLTGLGMPKDVLEFPWPMALIPVVGTSLLILGARPTHGAGRVLSAGPMLVVGKASYSLYLWHWPCLVLGTLLANAAEETAYAHAFMALGVIAGFASWRWVEPLGRRISYTRTWAPVCFVSMLALAAWSAFRTPDVPADGWGPIPRSVSPYDWRVAEQKTGVPIGESPAEGRRADVLLLGDSHALALASELSEHLSRSGLQGLVMASGGARLVDWNPNRYEMTRAERLRFESSRWDAIARTRPRLIVLSARWETFSSGGGMEAVAGFMSELRSRSPDSQVLVISQVPRLDFGDFRLNEWLNLRQKLGVSPTAMKVASSSRAGLCGSAMKVTRPISPICSWSTSP